jgi:hypothetical protein
VDTQLVDAAADSRRRAAPLADRDSGRGWGHETARRRQEVGPRMEGLGKGLGRVVVGIRSIQHSLT